MGIVVVAGGLSLVAALLGLGLLGIASTMWQVTTGDLMSAQLALFRWTVGAVLVGIAVRSIFLFSHRRTHPLRKLEYPGQLWRAGILTGGIAYSVIAILVAFLKGTKTEIDAGATIPEELIVPVAFIGIVPILIVMLAGYLTVAGVLGKLPQSKVPSRDERDLVRLFEFLIQVLRNVGGFIKRRRLN